MDVKYVTIIPSPSSGLPRFDAIIEEKAPPVEPPETLPPPTMDWVFNDGWYFVAGPYDRPKPICPTRSLQTVDLPKAKWVTDGAHGWFFVLGPFDKPRAICGVEPPDPEEPPTEPPVDPGCRWTYTEAGWVLICGPYDKPKPPHE